MVMMMMTEWAAFIGWITVGTIGFLTIGAIAQSLWNVFRPEAPVRGKHVLITGGSSGIGLELAKQFAQQGAKVTIWARNLERLQDAKKYISNSAAGLGEDCVFVYSVDVSDPGSVAVGAERSIQANGEVDILILNAGSSYPEYFENIPREKFESTMRLNYMGCVNVIQSFRESFFSRKDGHIVLVGSGASLIGMVGYTSYAPTKWAVRGLADSIRSEFIKFNVKVSIAYPPDTKTPSFQEELKTRPKELHILTPETQAFEASKVAKIMIRDLRKGFFHILSPDPIQNLLISLKTGVSPHRNLCFDLLMSPLIILIATSYQIFMDYLVMSTRRTNSPAVEGKKSQ